MSLAIPKSRSFTCPSVRTHVRRLDIPVYDQVRVCVSDGAEHIQKQADPRICVELAFLTVRIDMQTVDKFEDKVRLAVTGNAGVYQFGNMRVGKAAKDAAFPFEPLLTAGRDRSGGQELDRDTALEAAVGTFGEPDCSHSPWPMSWSNLYGPTVWPAAIPSNGTASTAFRETVRL